MTGTASRDSANSVKIRLSKSTVTEEDKNAVRRVLDAEYLGMGMEVQAFEDDIRAFVGGSLRPVCVSSGTAALHIALQACGIGPNDEVIVPSLTYVASFQAISATGAMPVACDVREDSLFIDINDARQRISGKTKAIMPVHYASDSQYMDGVYALARDNKLRVIEDAAHSFGCIRNGKPVGHEGDIICFSFDGIKNITSGEGGALLTADKDVLQKARDARLLGVENDTMKRYTGQRSWEFDVRDQGWRYHMSNIFAALGREQLKRIRSIKEKRQRITDIYQKELQAVSEITFLRLDYSAIIPHIFVIKILDGKRDALKEYLLRNNIECGVHYYPNHFLSKYRTSYPLPATEKCYGQILSIPCHLDLTETQQRFVIKKIRDFFDAE